MGEIKTRISAGFDDFEERFMQCRSLELVHKDMYSFGEVIPSICLSS
jgi:hypothetical protein